MRLFAKRFASTGSLQTTLMSRKTKIDQYWPLITEQPRREDDQTTPHHSTSHHSTPHAQSMKSTQSLVGYKIEIGGRKYLQRQHQWAASTELHYTHIHKTIITGWMPRQQNHSRPSSIATKRGLHGAYTKWFHCLRLVRKSKMMHTSSSKFDKLMRAFFT